MKSINGSHLALSNIESHNHICDLIYFEYPLLSLYSDSRENWMYMWCDRGSTGRNRWALFPVTREQLSEYFDKEESLHALFKSADKHWILEQHGWLNSAISDTKQSRRRLIAVDYDQVKQYSPSMNSLFDFTRPPNLTPLLLDEKTGLPRSGGMTPPED